jgi:hypothetical protein
MSSIPGASLAELQQALLPFKGNAECELKLHGNKWMSLALPGLTGTESYVLRSLQEVDGTVGPIQYRLQKIFLLVAIGSLLIVLSCSITSARSVVRLIADWWRICAAPRRRAG